MMSEALLDIRNLHVRVEDKEILHGVNLQIGAGETHVLMGPNGAGKSTLGYALMGHPKYTITEGEIWFKGERVDTMSPDKRAKAGLFLSFQAPLEVPGLTVSAFIRTAMEQRGEHLRIAQYNRQLREAMDLLQIDPSYARRDLNVGFSGGEKKKAEILQMHMLKPTLAILDETDSGLDVDAVRTVSAGVAAFQKDESRSLLIITHSTRILESLHVDHTHVLVEGKIAAEGDASLADIINQSGFEAYEKKSV